MPCELKCELCGAALVDAAQSICQDCCDGVRWTITEERWTVTEAGIEEQTADQKGDLP